jgi:hypothetical protein
MYKQEKQDESLQLSLNQLKVFPLSLQQLFMGALLDHTSLIHDKDNVRTFYG